MSNKGLTKKEEFFKVLNLISTKKVKVKYCRTIKERLRPSVQQESLALPKKIPSPSASTSSAGTSSEIPADAKKEEEPKLRGGFSLLKSMKKQQRLKRLKSECSGGSTVPSSKSLLSYLHRYPGTSTPDDSSSVESEIDEVMDNTAAERNVDAIQEVSNAAGKNRNKMKKNGIVKDMEPRMKKVSVEMKKMRKERWSLDTGGSSGDEGGRVVAGFAPASASERGVRSKQAAYRKLIGSLEQELEDEERAMTPPLVSTMNNPPLISHDFNVKSPGEATSSPVPPVDFDIVVEEVKEEKAPLMVRLVEDFSLQSESDDEDEDEEEVVEIKSEMMTAVQQPLDDIKEPSIDINDVEVKKEVAEEEEKEEKVLMSNGDEILEDEKSKVDFLEEVLVDEKSKMDFLDTEKSKVDFLDTLRLQSVSSLRTSDSGSKEASASRRTLNQYHQVLKELEQQVEQRTPRKKGRRLREDCSVAEDFGSDELNRLVERVRRESKMASRSKNLCKMRLRAPELRVKLLERRQYLGQKEKAVVVCNKHVSKMLAEDAPMWKRRRLTRPTLEEEEKSRVTAGLPNHVYVIPVRREEKMRQEEARRMARVLVPVWNNPTVPQEVKPGPVFQCPFCQNLSQLP